MHDDIEAVLLPEAAIHRRLDELARQIVRDYAGTPLTLVALLNGCIPFLADLLRRISLPLQVESLRVSSYRGRASCGSVRFHGLALPDVRGRRVLLVDDILDTGETLRAVQERFAAEGAAIDLCSCVLLRKERAKPALAKADYVAFSIPDRFVVGYGLDYNGYYRNLPYIGVLREATAR